MFHQVAYPPHLMLARVTALLTDRFAVLTD